MHILVELTHVVEKSLLQVIADDSIVRGLQQKRRPSLSQHSFDYNAHVTEIHKLIISLALSVVQRERVQHFVNKAGVYLRIDLWLPFRSYRFSSFS